MYLLTYCDCLLTCISEMGKFIIQSCQFKKNILKSPIFTKLLEKGRHIFDSLCSVYAVAQKQDIGNCLLEICQKLHKSMLYVCNVCLC